MNKHCSHPLSSKAKHWADHELQTMLTSPDLIKNWTMVEAKATASSLEVLLFFCFIVSAHSPSGALRVLKASEKQEKKPKPDKLHLCCDPWESAPAVPEQSWWWMGTRDVGSCKFGTAAASQLLWQLRSHPARKAMAIFMIILPSAAISASWHWCQGLGEWNNRDVGAVASILLWVLSS